MSTQNFFGLALIAGLILCTALMSAPAASAQTLGSGAYQVQVRNSGTIHPAVWRLQVSGNQITGMSEWGTRTDPMRGYIEGNRVVIQRDCRGQGINGPCQQVYTGVIGNGVIQGSFSGTGAAPNNVWTLSLGTPTNNSCFSADPGAGSTDRNAHYGWAQQHDAAQLRGNLIYKLNLLYRCPAMSDDQLSSAFATISVIIARYVPNANCFNGDPGVISTDWSAHKNWAASIGRQQSFNNLQGKTAAAFRCLDRSGQMSYFADVSVAIANAPFTRGGGSPQPQPQPQPQPPSPSGLQGTWRYSASCGNDRLNGTMTLNLGADGKYSGSSSGNWYGANSASITGGTLQGSEVRFDFIPSGWTSYYIWKGRLVSDGNGARIEGTADRSGGICNFTMTR